MCKYGMHTLSMKNSILEGLLKFKDAIKAKITERKYYMFHHFGKRGVLTML